MQEAEVSLRIAMYYIENMLTEEEVTISIDGAHIKTGNTIHFDIWKFFNEHDIVKIDGKLETYKGTYLYKKYQNRIIITSQPGIGDVVSTLVDGRKLYVESKKGEVNKSSQEYSLIREAIGQLMTGCEMTEKVLPVVAVPYSNKSVELATRWSLLPQIKMVGIVFHLVRENGEIVIV